MLSYHLLLDFSTPVSYPNGPKAGHEGGWGSEFIPFKNWSWKFCTAAQNFTNRLFWNTHTFKTISLLWKRCHPIYRLSVFSAIPWNNQQSTRNASYVLPLCCVIVQRTWSKDQDNPHVMSCRFQILALTLLKRALKQIKMWYACVNHSKKPTWGSIVHRIS